MEERQFLREVALSYLGSDFVLDVAASSHQLLQLVLFFVQTLPETGQSSLQLLHFRDQAERKD